jgi:hypothetical protein
MIITAIITSCLQVRTSRKDVTAIASATAPFISILAVILFLDLVLFVLFSTAHLLEPLEIFSDSRVFSSFDWSAFT